MIFLEIDLRVIGVYAKKFEYVYIYMLNVHTYFRRTREFTVNLLECMVVLKSTRLHASLH